MTAQKCKKRKDKVCKIVHWELCGKCGLERAKHWYDHKLEGVTKNETTKILWATMRLPNTELILYKYTHQQRIGIACEGDHRVTAKEKRSNKYD